MNPRCGFAAVVAVVVAGAAHAAPYTIDPSHTFVNWELRYLGVSTHRGRFDRKDGTVQFDRAAKSGQVDITIEMASASTGVAALDELLRSAEFFDAAKHPQARFTSERWVFSGDALNAVSGQLSWRGVTQPLTLKAQRFGCYTNPLLRREVCGGDFEATLQRSRFGVSAGLPGIADEVRLLIQIEAVGP